MKKLGYIFGLLSGLFWGITSILYGFINIDNLLTIFLLFIIDFSGLIVSGLYIFLNNENITINLKGLFFCFISGILGGPIGMLCYLKSIELVGGIITSSISISYPIFGAIFSFLFLKNKPTFFEILGLSLSIVSLGLFLKPSYTTQSYNINILWSGIALLTAMSWGAEIVFSSYAMKYYNGTKVYFFRQSFSSIGYLGIIFYMIDFDNFYLSNINYEIVIGIISSSILSYFLYYQSIYLIKPIKSMALNITYGIWILLLSVIFLNQNIDYKTIILCLGILTGTLFTIFAKKEKK